MKVRVKTLVVVSGLAVALVFGYLLVQWMSTITRLAHVKMFAFGGVGFAGVTTSGEEYYSAILSRPFAEPQFEKVLANGTPEAKAYALVAIHKLNPERFKILAAPFQSSKANVQTGVGCILEKKPLSGLIKRIEAGDFHP